MIAGFEPVPADAVRLYRFKNWYFIAVIVEFTDIVRYCFSAHAYQLFHGFGAFSIHLDRSLHTVFVRFPRVVFVLGRILESIVSDDDARQRSVVVFVRTYLKTGADNPATHRLHYVSVSLQRIVQKFIYCYHFLFL